MTTMNAVLATVATDQGAASIAVPAKPVAARKRQQTADSRIESRIELTLEQLIDLAEAAQKNGQIEQAIDLYREWTANSCHPQRHLALFNFGSLLQSVGKVNDAIAAYRNGIACQPAFAQAHINLGLALESAGDSGEALRSWSQVVVAQYLDSSADKSLVVVALNHIGRLQEIKKHYDLAEAALEQSLRLDPQQPGVIQHWVHIRQKACRWPVYVPLPGISMNRMLMCTSPLAQLAVDDDPIKQLLVASSFVERTYSFRQERLIGQRKYRHQRLRLGYVSGDLCVHAVGLLLAEFLEEHDRSTFELYGYDYSREDSSPHRERLKSAFEHLRPVGHLTDRQVAERVMQDEIDILIDLHGASSGARPGIFALHPAPLQGTYLGFIGTSGMPWFDFVIVDRYVVPVELTPYFTEAPLYVDGSFLPLTSHRPEPRAAKRSEFGLPADGFVMAALGNVYKINEPLFKVWLDILREAPQAVLWLVDDNAVASANLRNYATQAGVDPSRIVFTPRVGHDEFRSQLRLADVFLDTFPYNCGSTSNDVVEAGIPMVTASGRTMVSRMGGSILKSLGQGQMIASTLNEYKAMVVQLAKDGAAGGKRVRVTPQDIVEARKRMVRSMEHGLSELALQKSSG